VAIFKDGHVWMVEEREVSLTYLLFVSE